MRLKLAPREKKIRTHETYFRTKTYDTPEEFLLRSAFLVILLRCCRQLRFRKSLPGAGEGIRTPDPLITNQMLYQLSYASPNSLVLPPVSTIWLTRSRACAECAADLTLAQRYDRSNADSGEA